MNDTLINEELSVHDKSLNEIVLDSSNSQLLIFIGIISTVILVFLLFYFSKKLNKNGKKNSIKKDILKTEIDFTNIIDSSFNSKTIYDQLKKKCHPDRFVNDEEKSQIANKIFQELTKNKNNIKKLNELKLRAENQLNIQF